jgi:hypothetical protein
VVKVLEAGLMDIFRVSALTTLPAERIRELIRPSAAARRAAR